MKKITYLFLAVISAFGVQAQTDYYTALPNNGGTSQNGRAPQGAVAADRSVWIITAAELADAGFSSGDVINSLGFRYSVAQDVETTGNMIIYLQNASASLVTNNKSTTWATAIAPMTVVSNGSVTVPAATGTFDIPFSGGAPFTYTGGALFVAFDYQNSGTLAATPNTALCNTDITGGLLGAIGATPATTVTASNFRPETRLGKAVACSRPTALGVENQTLDSADAIFSIAGTGTVQLEYGPFGFAQGSGTTVNNVTSPYTIGGLSPAMVYDFYVKKDCGGGSESEWAGPFSFNTIFPAVDPPYNTSFQQVIFPFIGWEAIPDDTADAWFINPGLSQDGDDAAAAVITPTVAATARLYSVGVNLQANADVTVDYFISNFVNASTNAGSYALTIGTDKTPEAQTVSITSESGLTNTDYEERTITFTAPATGVYYFCFQNLSPAQPATGLQALLLDNFTVSQSLGVNDAVAAKFAVYPNPVNQTINIGNTSSASVLDVQVTDMNGRIVKNQKVDAVTAQISAADMAPGMYMINIMTTAGKVVKKFIKS